MSDLKFYPVDNSLSHAVEKIAIGSDDDLERQLIDKSTQPAILKFTPKDSKERFNSTGSISKWRSKGRELHWLIGPENDLAGIIWYGKSEFPLDLKLDEVPKYTFAIRIYDGYSGKGLARPFMTQSLRLFVKKLADLAPIWLQTDVDNPAALNAYLKFGYIEVARDTKRVTMVLPTAKMLEIANS